MSTVVYAILLLVGLPLLLWWLGSRRLWAVLRAGGVRDPLGDLAERHGLSRGEARRVAAQARRGERLADARLRSAAVDWATTYLAQEGFLATTPSRGHTTLRILLAVWVAGILGWLVYTVGTGQPGRINWLTVFLGVAVAVLIVRRRRGLRRAIEVNAEAREG